MAPRSAVPDARGRFGAYGGAYIPETLAGALGHLAEVYAAAREHPPFWAELEHLLTTYVGRPTPLQYAERLTGHVRQAAAAGKGAGLWLKREDLAHTGAHKINNTLGQGLLTRRMGKKRIIAETGAGQHGVASATAAAFLGLECDVYMGAEDARRQRLNVIRMRMLGARVIEVDAGSRTLKDATNEAMRDWMGSSEHTHYILGSVVGPHPFPMIVRDFQSVIGREVVEQVGMGVGERHRGTEAQRHRGEGSDGANGALARARSAWADEGPAAPGAIIACVGGGSNAAGIFYPFIDTDVRLIGVEAGGRGSAAGEHAAPLCRGEPGILHGSLSYVLQDAEGQTAPVHSCSAGLDYPGVGPEHAHWKDSGRVEYTSVTDAEALEAFTLLARTEGILPALESAHAIAHAIKLAAELPREQRVIICLSGRGDKDVDEAARLLGK